MDGFAIAANVILFFLIFGMSATVEWENFKAQSKNKKGIGTGILLQFIILPVLGFAVIKMLDMDFITGITLLIITSSPGGSYSNWFCSVFNADLALSVTMTAISTILALGMLPLNIYIYSQLSFSSNVVNELDWQGLGISLVVVVSAITAGLFSSWKFTQAKFRKIANLIGNIAGLTLIIFSAIPKGDTSTKLTGRPALFYVGVPLPIVLGLISSVIISSLLNLKKPERVTVAVECCYQNTGIAIATVLTIFEGADQQKALGIPFFYTGMQTLILGLYCLVSWKIGWTKAPANEKLWTIIMKSYEVQDEDTNEAEDAGDEESLSKLNE